MNRPVEVSADTQDRVGKPLIESIIQPEVERFNKKFIELSGSPLTGMEKEVLKVYLYQKLTKQL
jgi:hypothetical protein